MVCVFILDKSKTNVTENYETRSTAQGNCSAKSRVAFVSPQDQKKRETFHCLRVYSFIISYPEFILLWKCKSGSQLACQALGALPYLYRYQTQWGGDKPAGGQTPRSVDIGAGVGKLRGEGDKVGTGTSGCLCLYRTGTRCFALKGFRTIIPGDLVP